MKLIVNLSILGPTLLAGFALLGPLASASDDDTSADAPAGFKAAVDQSKAVILRVPINARGEINTNDAEIRLTKDAPTGAAFGRAFARAKPIGKGAAVDKDRDSSTSGCGWGPWGGGYYGSQYYYGGWAQPSYYYAYQPTYYYYSYSYSYAYAYSYATPYTYYSPSYGNYGYQYYYYPRDSYYYGGQQYPWY